MLESFFIFSSVEFLLSGQVPSSLLFSPLPNHLLIDFFSTTESEQGVAQAILRGIIDFKREPWPNISETAKSLVRQMLEPDPKRRLTAKQVLGT